MKGRGAVTIRIFDWQVRNLSLGKEITYLNPHKEIDPGSRILSLMGLADPNIEPMLTTPLKGGGRFVLTVEYVILSS